MTFVVGIDGSDISWAAFHAACRMIDRKKDTMWAYHVTNPGRYKEMPLNYQPGKDTCLNLLFATHCASFLSSVRFLPFLSALPSFSSVLLAVADTLKNNFEALSIREEVSDCVNVNWVCEEKESADSKVRDMICSFAHKKTADVLILGAYGTKVTVRRLFMCSTYSRRCN